MRWQEHLSGGIIALRMKTAPSILHHTTKKPTRSYAARAQRLKILVEKENKTQEEQKERSRLERELCSEFMKTFNLESDRLRVGARFFSKIANHALGPKHHLLDHERCFRRGQNFVVVSQTYGLPSVESALVEWVADSGAKCTLAPDWGFHYPGRAFLFMAEFTPEQKSEYTKRLDSQRN